MQPKEIRKKGNERIEIVWEDEHMSQYTFRYLRQNCHCASCVNEITGEKMLDAETVAEDLCATKAELVGNYALRFQFSDGHHTGIYPFAVLRNLCPCCHEQSHKK